MAQIMSHSWINAYVQPTLIYSHLRDLQRMELRFPQLKIVSPEDFLKELQP